MKLSIIIVNYNVKYYLEQCLHSVLRACEGIAAEIWVVDNCSVDGSTEMLRSKFPGVHLLDNRENLGFSRANNQAIRLATGEYILLLNPDTLVEDSTFSKVLAFMDAHPEAGGLGVKMLDGKGNFLPESKRGLPTPGVAFCKVFGLSALFPKSKVFGRYHLGYLPENEVQAVDVLSGAFMLLRKSALDTIGLLDEDYFMYGEDIDISYRLTRAGYQNYYFPDTRIIHYKGESTKKASLNYVYVFYKAMMIFAGKHFSPKNARLFSSIIHLAIYLRASLAILRRFLQHIFLPLTDAIIMFGGIYFIRYLWEYVILAPGSHYPPEFIYLVVPLYILVWIMGIYYSGGYDKPLKISKLFQGLCIGTIIILVFYALLSEAFRFSRAIILLGAFWSFLSLSLLRTLLLKFNIGNLGQSQASLRRYAVVGAEEEAKRVAELLRNSGETPSFIGMVHVNDPDALPGGFIGSSLHLKEIIQIYKLDVVIFCARDLPAARIIDVMTEFRKSPVQYKIAPPETSFIIGSKSISTAGDMYMIEVNSVSKPHNRRMKRTFDLLVCLFLFISLPCIIWWQQSPLGLPRNILRVLLKKRTWVGFTPHKELENQASGKSHPIKTAVLTTADAVKNIQLNDQTIDHINMLYARDYNVLFDAGLVLKNFKKLGRLN